MNWLRRIFRTQGSTQEMQHDPLADWRIVSAKNEALGNVVLRILISKPNIARISSYATAVEIIWAYEPQDGMPPSEVNAGQLDFERAIDDLTGDNELAELVQVSTGRGTKEWLFYAVNRDQFMQEFNLLLSGHTPYPLDITFYEDPLWKIWHETVDAIVERDA